MSTRREAPSITVESEVITCHRRRCRRHSRSAGPRVSNICPPDSLSSRSFVSHFRAPLRRTFAARVLEVNLVASSPWNALVFMPRKCETFETPGPEEWLGERLRAIHAPGDRSLLSRSRRAAARRITAWGGREIIDLSAFLGSVADLGIPRGIPYLSRLT